MDNSQDNEQILAKIFIPHSAERREDMKKRKGLFVHYTSAENAMKIIQSKKLWLRNVKCMNDYMEVFHGYELMQGFFKNPDSKELFLKALEPCGNEIARKAIALFDQWWENISLNTFISSISEHDSKEDDHGRLSMWRAYGQKSAAAIVFNAPFESDSKTGLNLLLTPTAYFKQKDLNKEFTRVIKNINDNIKFLVSQGEEVIVKMVFSMLVVNAVSLKHEGFKEEREWRIIYLPYLNPSELISRDIESINGVPQIVYKVPLEDKLKENIVGISIPQIFNKIIIGPTEYPLPLLEAFKVALEKAGIENPVGRVIVSGIPLRT